MACVPSQKGLVELPPQRHRFARDRSGDNPAGATDDLQIATNRERPIGLRIDRQGSIDLGYRIRLGRRRLARGAEFHRMM